MLWLCSGAANMTTTAPNLTALELLYQSRHRIPYGSAIRSTGFCTRRLHFERAPSRPRTAQVVWFECTPARHILRDQCRTHTERQFMSAMIYSLLCSLSPLLIHPGRRRGLFFFRLYNVRPVSVAYGHLVQPAGHISPDPHIIQHQGPICQ